MRTIVITPSRSAQNDLPGDEWHSLVVRSSENWNQGLAHCCSVRFRVAALSDRWLAAEDGVNLVALRSGQWCHNERCGKTSTFPLAALGMTTTYPEGASGILLREADVEINAAHARAAIAVDDARAGIRQWALKLPGSDGAISLEAVLTHELGHLLGLRDACGDHYGSAGRIERHACPGEQRNRVMHAPAQLLKPSSGELSELSTTYPPEPPRTESTLAALGQPSVVLLSIAALLCIGLTARVITRRHVR